MADIDPSLIIGVVTAVATLLTAVAAAVSAHSSVVAARSSSSAANDASDAMALLHRPKITAHCRILGPGAMRGPDGWPPPIRSVGDNLVFHVMLEGGPVREGSIVWQPRHDARQSAILDMELLADQGQQEITLRGLPITGFTTGMEETDGVSSFPAALVDGPVDLEVELIDATVKRKWALRRQVAQQEETGVWEVPWVLLFSTELELQPR